MRCDVLDPFDRPYKYTQKITIKSVKLNFNIGDITTKLYYVKYSAVLTYKIKE